MLSLIVFLFCLFAVLGTGVLSGYSDFKGMKIPNGYSAVVLGLFPLCYAALFVFGHVEVFQGLMSHLLAMLIVFSATAAMFSFGIMGAADSKLGSALALWVGLKGLMGFLFFTAMFGAVLAIVALILKRYKPVKNPKDGGWVAQVQGGASKVPYGIAIVFGALVAFWDLQYLDFAYLVQVFKL